jgi:hypothetical protein
MIRDGCITLLLLRPRAKSAPEGFQARPESIWLPVLLVWVCSFFST